MSCLKLYGAIWYQVVPGVGYDLLYRCGVLARNTLSGCIGDNHDNWSFIRLMMPIGLVRCVGVVLLKCS